MSKIQTEIGVQMKEEVEDIIITATVDACFDVI